MGYGQNDTVEISMVTVVGALGALDRLQRIRRDRASPRWSPAIEIVALLGTATGYAVTAVDASDARPTPLAFAAETLQV